MSRFASREKGIVLLVSLVLLLALTIIAITAANQSTLQERMATNSQMQNTAFQNTESGFKQWYSDFQVNRKGYIQRLADSFSGANFGVEVVAHPLETLAEGKAIRPDYSRSFNLNADPSGGVLNPYLTEIVVTGKACPPAMTCDVSVTTDGLARSQSLQGFSYLYDYSN